MLNKNKTRSLILSGATLGTALVVAGALAPTKASCQTQNCFPAYTITDDTPYTYDCTNAPIVNSGGFYHFVCCVGSTSPNHIPANVQVGDGTFSPTPMKYLAGGHYNGGPQLRAHRTRR